MLSNSLSGQRQTKIANVWRSEVPVSPQRLFLDGWVLIRDGLGLEGEIPPLVSVPVFISIIVDKKMHHSPSRRVEWILCERSRVLCTERTDWQQLLTAGTWRPFRVKLMIDMTVQYSTHKVTRIEKQNKQKTEKKILKFLKPEKSEGKNFVYLTTNVSFFQKLFTLVNSRSFSPKARFEV